MAIPNTAGYIDPLQYELLQHRLSLATAETRAVLRWAPRFADFEAGLDQVARQWAEGRVPA